MEWFKVLILCVIALIAKGGTVEQLPPILKIPGDFGEVHPVLVESVKENNLLGRSDGHDNVNTPVIGQDDGHEGQPIISRPDGHEDVNKPVIGQDDSHEKPLLGKPDGHDFGEPIIGRPDSHEGQKSKESEEEEDYNYDNIKEEDESDTFMEDYYGDDEPQEELIRCKRPLCRLFCRSGYKTDESGCPICECLQDPCERLECRIGKTCRVRDCPSQKNCIKLTAECVDDAPACAIPMCANYCENYANNERGCMTCDCVTPPQTQEKKVQCPEIECIGAVCATGYVKDEHGCTTCKCTGAPVSYPCAEPMCANRCDSGYKRNERGCMTCDCAEDVCPECESDEVCQHRMEGSETIYSCAPKPLCLLMKEGGDRLAAMNAPNCESDGKFSPLQCNDVQSQCWCVDDRGSVIDGTSTSVYIDEHKPQCVRNRTVSATLRMRLVVIAGNFPGYDYPATIPELLKSSLPGALGDCMLMDRQYISVIKTQEMIGGDEAGNVKTGSDVGDVLFIEARVRQDGFIDLPSAIQHMTRHVQSKNCLVAVESGAVLAPQLESLDVEYKFSHLSARQPLVTNVDNGMYSTEESWTAYCWSHTYLMMFAALLAGLVLISVILLAVIIAKRRRMRAMNFQHQRLQSQLSSTSDKIYLDGRDDNVLLINSGPIEEKTIRA